MFHTVLVVHPRQIKPEWYATKPGRLRRSVVADFRRCQRYLNIALAITADIYF